MRLRILASFGKNNNRIDALRSEGCGVKFTAMGMTAENRKRRSRIGDWLIDSVIVITFAGISAFLLPLVTAWCIALSLHLGRTWYWVHSIALGDFLPNVILGSILGLATARLIRHRKLWLA